ncbi:hypothetical protein [Methylobacterium brachythecii]|nr:hypothetical protein [Methylobacterium brachythecii]MBB3901842.1 hypothetical protein [Methylobacterium brachythecii]
MTMRLYARLLSAGFVGVVGGPTRAQEPQVVELLKGYRCMLAAASSGGEPLVVRDAPRAGAAELGMPEEPVIAAVSARSVKG